MDETDSGERKRERKSSWMDRIGREEERENE